jgi:tetratricopeptide (TPR) repeat protein
VISKAAPPVTPKVIKRADPPATPRVISTAPQATPPKVVPKGDRPDAPGSRPGQPRPAQDAGRPAVEARHEPAHRRDLRLPTTRQDPPTTRQDQTTGVRPEHAPVTHVDHADRLEQPAGERQRADYGPVDGPPVAPEPVRARVEPTPINGHAGGPGTHSVGSPPPRPEPTRPLPRQGSVPRVGEAPAGRPAPMPPAADRRTPAPTAATDPYAGHQQSPPAGPAYQPASGSAGAIQVTPPAPGDRPSVQTLSELPLMPIGRIATSGPDTAPKKYTDQDLGATWFGAATTAEPAALAAAPSESAAQQPAAEEPAAQEQPATAPGLVIDLDLTGILNGTDAGELVVVSPAPAGSAQSVPASGSRQAADSAADPGAGPTDRQPGTATSPGTPPQGTAARRAGTAGTQWAARDEATKLPLSAESVSAEVQVSVRPLQPLAADALAAIRWRLDGGTLREVVDDRDALAELGERLDAPLIEEADTVTRAGLLSVRAEVYRLLDKLGLAAAASRLALAHAESSRDVQAMVIAQAELAHVLRLRGDFTEADRLFEQAASSEAPEQLRSMVHENAGRSCFDQGRHMEALDHFARSVRLGNPEDTDLVERIDVSLEAVYIHALRDGWGPYPRLRREILGPGR